MKKKIILIVLLLFIFINKVQAKNKIIKYADFSQNEIILSEDNYLIVGNAKNDFKSIKYFADKYCSNRLGNDYRSSSIQISTNVAYAYCLIIDVLAKYNLKDNERDCFANFELSLNFLYNRDCENLNKDFESILIEVKKYRERVNILNSKAFIYKILNEDISKKILKFETTIASNSLDFLYKELKNKNTQKLKQMLATLQNPLHEQINTTIVNRNIKLCKLYKFVEGTELYLQCILTLMKNDQYLSKKYLIDLK